MTFGRKKEEKRVLPTIPAPPLKVTNLDRLKAMREARMNELLKLNFDITQLDHDIGYLERFPMIERIVESLRNR